jgi:hypothetical protein
MLSEVVPEIGVLSARLATESCGRGSNTGTAAGKAQPQNPIEKSRPAERPWL